MRTLTIARATFREAIRQPVSILILFIAILIVYFSQFVNVFYLDESVGFNVIRQMSAAQSLITGIVIAVFSASAVLSDEIENKTVVTLLAKPVSRYQIVLGKYLGIVGALAGAFLIMIIVSALTAWWVEADIPKPRVNPVLAAKELPVSATGQNSIAVTGMYKDLLSSRKFDKLDHLYSFGDLMLLASGQSSSLSARAPFSASAEYVPPRLPGLASLTGSVFVFLANPQTILFAQAFILSFAQILILAAVAVAVSTRLPLIFNALACACVFIFGNLSWILAQTLLQEHPAGVLSVLKWPVIAVCYLFPDLGSLDLTEALQVGSGPADFTRVIGGFGYGIFYAAVILVVGVMLFERREVT